MLTTLIDNLLAEQGVLQTPAARFGDFQDRGSDMAEHYRNLIPLTAPGPGEQYAFEVSLDSCTSCKACVAACHSLNGLDEDETWRDVGLITGGADEPGWQQTVTTACHHCADPGCLTGCPVGAYEKSATTGIVRHLDDQCIGCSYCLLKCSYDVPKFSKKRGIVRKCDMCQGRLAAGEAPACVQACPTSAIRIVKRDVAEIIRDGIAGTGFLTGAPTPRITLPSTLYVGRKVPATAQSANQDTLDLQHTHLPLVLMLTLTQAGLGLLLPAAYHHHLPTSILAATIFFSGMAASILHLGRPLGAWRFFLGLRTSWLSREILAFSAVAPLVAIVSLEPLAHDFLPAAVLNLLREMWPMLLASLAVLSLSATFTSVMIYVDTHRPMWRMAITGPRFFGTFFAFVGLGFATSHPSPISMTVAMIAIILKLIPEARFLRDHDDPDAPWTPDEHTARLLRLRSMAPIRNGRFVAAIFAIVFLSISPWASIGLMLIAELLERIAFFRTVHSPKMPGNPSNSRGH